MTPSGPRVLVAGIGNVLRGDDGFGVAVLEMLKDVFADRPSLKLVESGIAGIGLVQHLMDGYDALIIVDAVERGAEPGRLFVLEPDLEGLTQGERTPIDVHEADAEGVIRMASATGHLPPRVWIVGCQAQSCDELGAGLSAPVRRAVPEAVARVQALVASLATTSEPVGLRQQDETLQILYWLRGEGLLADAGVTDLRRFLDTDAAGLSAVLERLEDLGLVQCTSGEGSMRRYALTAEGVREGGRRFADEFADMTKPGHGECGDPECECHRTGSPADCRHRQGHV